MNDDIDIYNPREVNWTLSYLCQTDQDLIVFVLSELKDGPRAIGICFENVENEIRCDYAEQIKSIKHFEKIKIKISKKQRKKLVENKDLRKG